MRSLGKVIAWLDSMRLSERILNWLMLNVSTIACQVEEWIGLGLLENGRCVWICLH